MRKLLLLIPILLLFCPEARATWTPTQVQGNSTTCSSGGCAVTVTSTGAGHLLVAGLLSPNTGATITAVTAGACVATWTHVPNSTMSNAATGSGDMYYCLNSTSGQTSINISTSASCGSSCVGVIWEAASSLGSIAVDTGAVPSQNATDTACTSCAGVGLTLGGNNDFIAVMSSGSQNCTGLTGSGFTNDLGNPQGDGIGHGITSGSVTAPATWTMASSATLILNAAAFQEGAAATPTCQSINLLGVGCK